MVLAQSLYGAKLEILLNEGTVLNDYNLQRIKDMGYAGVYIHDEMSSEITVKDVIPPELRVKTIKATKEILQQAEIEATDPTRRQGSVTRQKQDKMITPLIDALIANPHRLVDMIDAKPYDEYMYYHAANVIILSLLIGVELGLSGVQLYELGLSSLMHDVGNMFIPKNVLNKPGKLSDEEYEIIKSHTQMGFNYLRDNFNATIETCMGALHHHENYDGSGYPNGLKKDKISIYGRVIAITDVYDALTSRRSYRQPMFPPAAMEFMNINSGTMFDPTIIKAFQKVVSLYPSGICVELSSGAPCIVVENFAGRPERPRVRLVNSLAKTPLYIDLFKDAPFASTNIKRIINL